ncbi:hypothetical protein NECAME_13900 [Necator americanus]|uniref:Uncharacterized protein n=1 Tax=Necator americanus TaxID=51031 RepID=W2SUJ1_NECAM|nr:hypothetical protein NECAME_13900 [Necator americanus]ETN72362.1 hypothetical protein NECAME_13900 [Necator americanus]
MSLHYTEDVSSLYPQIPSSVDELPGLFKALKDGTEEVKGLLKYSCNVILECRCCQAVFRHPENFHKHKLTVCRAYHKPITPTYEQVLKFQKKVAAMYDPDMPSSSKLFDEEDDGEELVPDDNSFIDTYDGIEEFCDYDPVDSPEPGEVVELPEEGVMVYGVEEVEEESLSEIEEGEYIEPEEGGSHHSNCSASPPPAQVNCEVRTLSSSSEPPEEMDSNNASDDAISLSESPPHGSVDIALFEDNLLDSPTENEYFGKGYDVVTSPSMLPFSETK